jgi:nitrous oxidase accessory protein NosD
LTAPEVPAPIYGNRIVDNWAVGIDVAGPAERVHNNTVLRNGYWGIVVTFVSNGTVVEHNRVEGHASAGVWVGDLARRGIPNTTVTANRIADNGIGVEADAADGLAVHRNNIVGNDEGGLVVAERSQGVDATRNWWGCSMGPSAADCDDVEGEAGIEPWLVEENPTAGVLRS